MPRDGDSKVEEIVRGEMTLVPLFGVGGPLVEKGVKRGKEYCPNCFAEDQPRSGTVYACNSCGYHSGS